MYDRKLNVFLWFTEFKLVPTVQHCFRRSYIQDPLTDKTIIRLNISLKKNWKSEIKNP